MSRDLSEVLDEYCEEMYGHTNWAWTDSMTKEELETSKGHIENDIFFYEESRCWDCNKLESVCECEQE
mgnify:FL=1|jgi:NAD-dependent dihydropyrimidine dehydrogenase PreA subunit